MTRCDGLARKPACSRRESGRGRGGSASTVQAAWRGQGALVQKALKTASKYAEMGGLFTPIQFKKRTPYTASIGHRVHGKAMTTGYPPGIEHPHWNDYDKAQDNIGFESLRWNCAKWNFPPSTYSAMLEGLQHLRSGPEMQEIWEIDGLGDGHGDRQIGGQDDGQDGEQDDGQDGEHAGVEPHPAQHPRDGDAGADPHVHHDAVGVHGGRGQPLVELQGGGQGKGIVADRFQEFQGEMFDDGDDFDDGEDDLTIIKQAQFDYDGEEEEEEDFE